VIGGAEMASILPELVAPFVDPLSRTHWFGLLLFALVGLIYLSRQKKLTGSFRRIWVALRHPSSLLDIQLLFGRQLLGVFLTGPTVFSAWWVSTKLVRRLDKTFGVPETLDLSESFIAVLYSVSLFVVWDFSRYFVHWCMHRFSFLWQFHQVHHSAEILTPLTFHRVHPVESFMYTLRSVLVTGFMSGIFYWSFRGQLSQLLLWGVPAIGFSLNVLFGNFRHSHIWIPFPNWLERWFISPAQHQMHHSSEAAFHGTNYGTWLSIWDRIFGSLLLSNARPDDYGVPKRERNHTFNLVSAWFGPFRGLLP
jgi:sterol desaturase/sphingolipid hydroxylase (fatty acid hydroxylase superfamily)